ncbi:MAG: NUDIX hydrolase [Planctomycetota bacterium]|jgi:ADP-ribose pyrophosphatase YjhB (NUDIX family)
MTHDPEDFREPHLRRADFVGAFGVLERDGHILMVQNRRVVGGRSVLTWDLPGGQVEPGELLPEALTRELDEEVGVEPVGDARFLFFQEGEKRRRGRREYAWRSFFFAVDLWRGEPRAGAEILDVRWFERQELEDVLHAPYHDSFLLWLREGGSAFRSIWDDATDD